MNEIIPPSEPGKEPPKPVPTQIYYKSEPPSRKLCAVMGLLLFIVSAAGSFAFPPLCLVGFAAAIGSLFFQGYRFIFVGYALTLGLLLLCVIIYCANNPLRID